MRVLKVCQRVWAGLRAVQVDQNTASVLVLVKVQLRSTEHHGDILRLSTSAHAGNRVALHPSDVMQILHGTTSSATDSLGTTGRATDRADFPMLNPVSWDSLLHQPAAR
jgi:hypothetical protein